MKEMTVTINGKQVKGKEGDTVLDVCKANGIQVPTLCHMDGLSDVGACRICLVDVEKERRPVPACTYPAREGMSVKTNTPELEKSRRLILELIFTERNHYCMFCDKSGDCELQNLAYEYQMDHVRYPYAFPTLPVDTLNEDIMIDHNRCVFCGRCVRVCDEVVGVHALEPSKRGWKAMIAADLEQSLGESSCVTCGACVQACPTGAILSKLSMYKGKTLDCKKVSTVCPACGIGCQLDVLVKDNNVVRIEAPDIKGPQGALCKRGRFGLLEDKRAKVTSAMVRNKKGELEECSLDRAVDAVAERIKGLKGGLAALASTCYPSETLALFNKFVRESVGSDNIDTLDGRSYRLIASGIARYNGKNKGLDLECSADEILDADCIMLVGADPLKTNPIIASMILRAEHKGAKLIVVDASQDALPLWSSLWLKPKAGTEGALLSGLAKTIVAKGLAKGKAASRAKGDGASKVTGVASADLEAAATIYGSAKKAVIVYGDGLLERKDPALVTSLFGLAALAGNVAGDSLRVISLKSGGNSRGAWEKGMASKDVLSQKPKAVYLLLGDEEPSAELVKWLRGVDFLIVQARYRSPATEMARVVLPSSSWTEREGSYVSLDGKVKNAQRVLTPGKGSISDHGVLLGLAKKLGHSLS